ncbi:MAG: pitrilysin family protein [Nitrospirota bacterium]|jgi:predicted Zn-dependent peptidase
MKRLEVNNTRLLFHRNQSDVVNVQILTNVGSSVEEPATYGAAHFLEHMFFKGTATRDAKQINRDANRIGGKLNAWTWFDQTVYYITALRERLDEAFEIVCDVYQNATFPEEELEKEREVIVSEMRRYDDDPASYLADRAYAHLCESGIAHPVIGTEKNVRGIGRQTLIDFKERYYGGHNVLISVVGNVTETEVAAAIERHFPSRPTAGVMEVAPTPYRGGDLHLTKPDIQEARYSLLYPALPDRHPDATRQDVMCYVLGGDGSALLFERIREELGLCYGIFSGVSRFDGFSVLEVATGCAPENLATIHDETRTIIERLCAERIDEERLEMVKAALLSSLRMTAETSNGYNRIIAVPVLKGETENPYEKKNREIAEVTIDDVRRLAEETFSIPPLYATLVAA